MTLLRLWHVTFGTWIDPFSAPRRSCRASRATPLCGAVDFTITPLQLVPQGTECRKDATPDMNICTDKAISSMPITRSSAVSTLSPSQRNR